MTNSIWNYWCDWIIGFISIFQNWRYWFCWSDIIKFRNNVKCRFFVRYLILVGLSQSARFNRSYTRSNWLIKILVFYLSRRNMTSIYFFRLTTGSLLYWEIFLFRNISFISCLWNVSGLNWCIFSEFFITLFNKFSFLFPLFQLLFIRNLLPNNTLFLLIIIIYMETWNFLLFFEGLFCL